MRFNDVTSWSYVNLDDPIYVQLATCITLGRVLRLSRHVYAWQPFTYDVILCHINSRDTPLTAVFYVRRKSLPYQ